MDNLYDYYDVKVKDYRLKSLKKHSNFSFYQVDIENLEGLREVFKENSFDCVINEAARAGVTIRENFKKLAQHLKIPIFYGKGVLKDTNTVIVEPSGEELKGRYILLATGSSTTSLGDIRVSFMGLDYFNRLYIEPHSDFCH